MEITFREIREFGKSMIILDQHPSQISMPALGNTYCTICFNLKHRTDVTAMSQAMLLEDEEKAILGNLQVGEAVVRLQGRSVKPFLIQVPEFSIRKGGFSDVKVIHHMTKLGLLATRDQRVQRPSFAAAEFAPVRSLSAEPTGTLVGQRELAFLNDLAAFTEGGVAEQYKRLGWSARQGQRVKHALVEKGVVQELLETTRNGKLRVIRLTEKGRLALDNAANSASEAA